MPALRKPGLGPIVGHTIDSACRLWIRGSDTEDEGADLDSNRRTLGVISVFEMPRKYQTAPFGDDDCKLVWEAIRNDFERAPEKLDLELFYFRLHRQFDRTGTFAFGAQNCITGKPSPPLKPATRYIALVGTLVTDDPYEDDHNISDKRLAKRLPDPQVWKGDLLALPAEGCTASFRTFATANKTPGSLNFILGSCRYPGVLWKVKQADRIFDPLRQEALGRAERPDDDIQPTVPTTPANFVLMVGDQIYADMLNRHVPIGLADTFEEFQERYLTAFGSRNMRKLLCQVPTYMILDDHEIEDNWTQDRITKAASRKVFNFAIGAYMSYQWSHSPRTFGSRLYYSFECNGYPFFVLDTRTQRFMDDVPDKLEDNHLLGRPMIEGEEPGQLERLLAWLSLQQKMGGNRPKFIVTSSVFAPNPLSAREGRKGSKEQQVKWKEDSDSWPAFPATRAAVLSHIIKNAIQNVVFLSGDIHCANVAAIEFSGSQKAAKLKAFAVTSSAFYWPFPFADGEPSSYVHDSKATEQRDTFTIDKTHKMDYRAWNFTQEDNFCRVDLDPESHRLRVTAIDKKGAVIRKRDWLGRTTGDPVISDLELVPW